jgi:Effector-associated domain 2
LGVSLGSGSAAGLDAARGQMAEPANHRTILVVDVEKFSDHARTDPQRLTVRAGLYEMLQKVFDETGISWGDCHHEDRGDGVLILVSPDIPKTRCSDDLPHRLTDALRQYNQAHSREEQIRLRLALNAGEIYFDEHGVTSDAVNKTFRLLNSDPLRQALHDTPGVLALIASPWFYDEVIRQSPAFRSGSYFPVIVDVKETETVAWITTPGYLCPTWRRVSGEPWLIRLLDSSGRSRGPGILLCGRYAITSAQVVARALAFPERDASAWPAGQVSFDVPARPDMGVQRAEIIFWRPALPGGGPSGLDVAGLSIVGPAIRGVGEPVLRFEPATSARIARVRSQDSLPAWARLAEPSSGMERILLTRLTPNMPPIDRTHHGSDVIDEQTGEILGLAAISAASGSRDRAWMTSIGLIARQWPLLQHIGHMGKRDILNEMRSYPLGMTRVLWLAESCLRTPALARAQSRHMIISELPPEVLLAVPRSSVDRADLIALLWSCAHVPGAFNKLAEKVRESPLGGRNATDVANELERF